jgi:hypothetical protein
MSSCNLEINSSSFAPDISKAKSSSINVNRLMERVPLIDSWSGKGKHIDALEQGHLEFKDVHFRYPTRYLSFETMLTKTVRACSERVGF